MNDLNLKRSIAPIIIFQALTDLLYFFPDITPSIEPGATNPELISIS
jgi:hypothetical protein